MTDELRVDRMDDHQLIAAAVAIVEDGDAYGAAARHPTSIRTRQILEALADRLAASRLSRAGDGVEAVARALWSEECRLGMPALAARRTPDLWLDQSAEVRERWRHMARAALATLPGGGEMREAAAKVCDIYAAGAGASVWRDPEVAEDVAREIAELIRALPLPHEPAKQEGGE